MNKKKINGDYVFDPIRIEKRLEYGKRGVLNSDISEKNKKLILDYCEYIQDIKKLSKDRIYKWLYSLKIVAEMLGKDFEAATIEDIRELDKKITNSDYSDNTKGDFQRLIKCFYKWVKSPDKTKELDEFPPEVKSLKVLRAETKPLRNDQVINWDDVVLISAQIKHYRDRAFVKTLWESCNRIREHLRLKVGDVLEDEGGYILNTSITKTGKKTFQKPIDLAEGDLRDWLKNHPRANDPEAPLWIRIDGRKPNEALDYYSARKFVKTAAKRAGITKAINPHNFRHGSLTYHSGHLSDSQVKYLAGWSQGTRMLDTYLHPGLDSIRLAKRKMIGKNGVEFKPPEELTIPCPYCNTEQDKSRSVCFKCGKLLEMSRNATIQRAIVEEVRRVLFEMVDKDEGLSNVLLERRKETIKAGKPIP